MKPSKISVLGFQFHGGSEDGCIFALYPKCSKDTLVMIQDAKDFFRNSGSKWAEMTMISRDGQKEIVNLYLEQDKAELVEHTDFQDTVILDNAPSLSMVDDDPYSWSYGN